MDHIAVTLPTTTRAYGAPRLSEAGLSVLSVHLHRYLAPFLTEHGLAQVWVVLGFEGTAMPTTCIEVTYRGATTTELDVSFAQLAMAARSELGGISLVTEPGRDPRRVLAVAAGVTGDPGAAHFQAFAMASQESGLGAKPRALNDLSRRTAEAVRSYRTNALRILFEERDLMPIKEFLYTLFDRLPDLCGVDHSTALILTGSLEAMALDTACKAEFEVVAERLYYDDDGPGRPDRLVGLLMRGDEADGLLGYAFTRVQRERRIGLHIFVPEQADGASWVLFGESHARAVRFGTRVNRPVEGMTVLIPLLARDEVGADEMLGFLCLNFREPVPIGQLASQLLEGMAQQLARYLRRSTLFSLTARQLLLLEEVRAAYQGHAYAGDASTRLEAFIKRVTALVVARTAVPCFAIGHVVEGHERRLQIVQAHGFTRFKDVSLPIDDLDDVRETSIASLAVRLRRAVVLAGGEMRDGQPAFQNALWVNEASGEMVDARRVTPERLQTPGWRQLSEYYKASRDVSYATLAFPIGVGGAVLGVVVLEVDRTTDWLWWTGFGSQLFFRLLANELGVAFKLLGAA